jgi:hypothetical protein
LSTLFQNIPLVRSLEAATGRRTVLVSLSGFADQHGRLKAGNSWAYEFSDPSALDVRLHPWSVNSEGFVTARPSAAPIVHDLDRVELGPHLAVDSPEAIRLALSYGAQPYVDRFPTAYVALGVRFRARVATWEVHFEALPGAPCSLGPIYIDASTGVLLSRDLNCLTRL